MANYIISRGESSNGIILNSCDSMTVFLNGVANSTTVNSGGSMIIYNSGIATEILENGGYVDVRSGASVSFVSNLLSGLVISSANATVHSGTTANSTTVISGGCFIVAGGGIANSTTVNTKGSLSVSSGGIAIDTTVSGWSYINVGEDGKASGVTLNAAGSLSLRSGGSADDITINAGGILEVSSGGTATNIVWTPCVGGVRVYEGGSVTFASQYSGVYYGADNQLLSQAQVLDSKELKSWEFMYVMSGGTANNISGKGSLFIASGGTANNVTANGGRLEVFSGGTATNIVWTPCLGSLSIFDGAYVTFASQHSGVYYGFNNQLLSQAQAMDSKEIQRRESLYVMAGGTANKMTVYDAGSIFVSSGGTANDIAVNSFGSMWVYDGGIASNAAVINYGSICVSRGGVANGTVVNSKGHMYISSGGMASNTIINTWGSMLVSSGGTATGVTANGGRLEVFSGGTAGKIEINSSGFVIISDGGKASGVTANSGGYLYVSSGGTANNITATPKGIISIRDGGTASSAMVSSGGYFHVCDGASANSITVSSGGSLSVSSGGTATNVLWTLNKDSFEIQDGAFVTYIIPYSGVMYYDSRDHLLSSAMAMDSKTVSSNNGSIVSMFVFSGGTADNTRVSSGGSFRLFSGGVANDTIVDFSGSMCISSGGTANNTTLNESAYLYIFCGGTANSITVSSRAMISIESGGTAFDADVKKWGIIHVHSSGIIDRTTFSSNSYLLVFSGGTATNIVALNGAKVILNIASDTRIQGTFDGTPLEIKNGILSDYAIITGYDFSVLSGGTLTDIQVRDNGTLRVSAGGSATNIQIDFGGIIELDVDKNTCVSGVSFGSAFQIENGLVSNYKVTKDSPLFISSGAIAIDTTVCRGGLMFVYSGGEVNRTTVSGSGSLELYTSAIANSTTISSGGTMDVCNALVNSTTVCSMGSMLVSSQAVANGTVVNSKGLMYISSGGTANGTTVNAKGELHISSGGTAVETIVSSGGSVFVISGGTADNTMVGSGGKLFVSSGGNAVGTVVRNGGTLIVTSGENNTSATIQSGGKITGYFDCSGISFDSGAVVDFGVFSSDPGNKDPLVKNLSLVQDKTDFSLTIANSQKAGTYILADGLSSFDQVISVCNPGMQIGSLSLDQTVRINGDDYTLSLNNGELVLSIEADKSVSQYVYLDFDGEDVALYRNPDLNLSIAALVQDPGFSQEQRQTILSGLSEQYAGTGIVFTLERPADVEYSTLYFGKSDAFLDYGDFFGIAETHDGNNRNKSDNAYVLLDQSYSTGQIVSVASHMLDHLLGYSYSVLADGSMELNNYAELTYLLSTKWSQNYPYNKFCPIDSETGENCLTGCVATAYAQLINYWIEKGLVNTTFVIEDWDEAITLDTRLPIDDRDPPELGYLSFAETNKLLADYTPGDENSIAALCFALGAIGGAQYSWGKTGQYSGDTREFWSRFGLGGDSFGVRSYLPRTAWLSPFIRYQGGTATLPDDFYLVQEMLQGRPVSVAADTPQGGHEFLIDGYDSSTNKFHVNYGSGRSGCTWFSLQELNAVSVYEIEFGISPVVFPDLAVGGLSVEETVINPKEDIILHFTVSNTGKEKSLPTMACVYFGETLLGTLDVAYVSPGFSRDLTFSYNAASLPLGRNTISVMLYSQNEEEDVSCSSLAVELDSDAGPRRPAVSADVTEPTNGDVLVSAEFGILSVTREYSLDGKSWTSYTKPVQFTENGTAYFRGTDAAGNVSEVVAYTVSNIDRTAPDKPAASADITTETSGKVTVTAVFSEDSVVREYSKDGSEWKIYSAPLVFSENGTVYFRGTDAAGNVSGTTSYEVTNIKTVVKDITPPTITIIPNTTAPAQSVSVTAVFADDVSVATIQYRIGDGAWTDFTGPVTMTENALISFRATDTSGNSTVESCYVSNIQQSGPEPLPDVLTNAPDSGWNDYLYDKKKGWNVGANISQFATNKIVGTGEIDLDVPGTIDRDGRHNMFGNDGTNIDAGDVAKIDVDTAAKLTFMIDSTEAGTFYVYQDGVKNGRQAQLQVAKISVKANATAMLNDVCLAADGNYYVAMVAKNVKRVGTEGLYKVNVVNCTFFVDADSGVNNIPRNYYAVSVSVERGTKSIVLDSDPMTLSTAFNNFVGFGDSIDYMKLDLASNAYLSFSLKADGAAKFTLWKQNANGKLSKVGGVTSLSAKNVYKATTKAQFLDADKYTYYISMESSNAAKGGKAYYNVELNSVGSRFFDSADNGENNWLFDKKSKTYNDDEYLVENTVSASGDPLTIHLDNNVIELECYDNFVGYGDAADYAKIVLTEKGTLSFEITALADVTFELWQKGKDKKGKDVLTSLQKKTDVKVRDYNVGASATTASLSLDAGEYYISVTAKKTTANEKGSAFYNVTANFTAAVNDAQLDNAVAAAGFASGIESCQDDKSAWQNIASLA